jgi:hypothetical protein
MVALYSNITKFIEHSHIAFRGCCQGLFDHQATVVGYRTDLKDDISDASPWLDFWSWKKSMGHRLR